MKKILIASLVINAIIGIYFTIMFINKDYVDVLEDVENKSIKEIVMKENYKIKYVYSSRPKDIILYKKVVDNYIMLYVSNGNENFIMASYIGKSITDVYDEIEYIANELNINFEIKHQEGLYNNIIVSQYPNPTEEIEDKIILYVSVKNVDLELPNFVGKSIYDCLQFEEKNHLNFSYIFVPSDYDSNIVLKQDLEPGTKISEYYPYEIKIYISKH